MRHQEVVIRKADDLHLHLRSGEILKTVLPHTAKRCARAIVMPNLTPPIRSVGDARVYRDEIVAALNGERFEPLMTLYLTSTTLPKTVREAKESGIVFGMKLYPAGATTNSEYGISAMRDVWPVLDEMQRLRMPLLVHGEVTDPEVDIFDRERVFIETELSSIVRDFPDLRIVLEHVTSEEGIHFVLASHGGVAATITPHHLLLTRNDMLVGGIRPHHYCLPVVKTERDRRALVDAAVSGSPKFFAGTDSAPHPRRTKESGCGRAGIYSGHASVELYAEVFDREGSLEGLNDFLSGFGAGFYGLPKNEETIRLVRREWTVPELVPCDGDAIVPFYAGRSIGWSIA